MSTGIWIAVAALGSVAAMARFLVGGWVTARSDPRVPLGTFAVNVSGALLLGLVTGLALTGNALLLVGTATIGSYTTFSTWMLETHRLTHDERGGQALANVLGSAILGVAAVALGRTLGGWL